MKKIKPIWIIIGIVVLVIFMNQSEKKQTTISNCKVCGEGFFDNCEASECYALGTDCVFIDKTFGGECYSKNDENSPLCSIPIGQYCSLYEPLGDEQPGWDDSTQDPYCSTGWCKDVKGFGGICENAPSNREPHQACAEKVGFCISFFDQYLHKYTGSCQMSTIVGIGGIVVLFIFMMMAMK